METELTRYNATIKHAMRSKSITAAKLADMTGIAPEYISALLERSVDALPALPYVRGYLVAIAEALELDAELLWEEFRHEQHTNQSGKTDTLPFNRFAPRSVGKRTILIGLAVVIVLVLLIPRLSDFWGKPALELSSPSGNNIEASSEWFTIRGTVANARDKVLVNGDEAFVNDDGLFEKEVYLQEGSNTFTITARRLLGKESSLTRTILYIAPPPTESLRMLDIDPLSTSTEDFIQ